MLRGQGGVMLTKRRAGQAVLFFIGSTTLLAFQNFSFAPSLSQNHCDGKYASPTGKAMFFYQGDYSKIARDADQLGCLMAKFDLIQITHGFDVRPAAEFAGPVPPDGLALKNGARWNNTVKTYDYAYKDAAGRGIDHVIARIRSLKPHAKIFVYVPATADNPLGPWDNSSYSQNFICPLNRAGISECADFNAWVLKWHGLYDRSRNLWIDGFFVDMVNPFYVHASAWGLQALAIKSLRNPATGRGYAIMANTLATEKAYYYPSFGPYETSLRYKSGSMTLSPDRPVIFAARPLGGGDQILVEGFHVKSGKLNLAVENGVTIDETERILADVRSIRSRGIGWSAISSEFAYVPPMLTPKYLQARDGMAWVYLSYAQTYLDFVWNDYQSFKPRYSTMLPLDFLNYSPHYGYRKTPADMAKYLIDRNVLIANGFLHDYMCQWYDGSSSSASGITAQESASSCYRSRQVVDCGSSNYQTAWRRFTQGGGSYFTYTEANLGTYSQRLSTCPLVGQ